MIQRETQLWQSVQNATRRSKLEGLLGVDFGGGSLGKGNDGGSSSTGEDAILDIGDISCGGDVERGGGTCGNGTFSMNIKDPD